MIPSTPELHKYEHHSWFPQHSSLWSQQTNPSWRVRGKLHGPDGKYCQIAPRESCREQVSTAVVGVKDKWVYDTLKWFTIAVWYRNKSESSSQWRDWGGLQLWDSLFEKPKLFNILVWASSKSRLWVQGFGHRRFICEVILRTEEDMGKVRQKREKSQQVCFIEWG